MSNALKFTPRGGHHPRHRRRPPRTAARLVSVRDNGPGIPPDEIEKVLQPFGQGSLAHETAEGGTGLGLPIVKGLIELHGGSFELGANCAKARPRPSDLPAARVVANGPAQVEARYRREHATPEPADAGADPAIDAARWIVGVCAFQRCRRACADAGPTPTA